MKKLALLFILVCASIYTMAQFKDPVKWDFTSVKKSDKVYEITFTANIDKSWHIYSQNTPKGGPRPTKIVFKANPLATITGLAKETGTLKKKHEEVFGVDVNYYDSKVVFTQTVTLKSAVKTSVAGTVDFMVCNDSECLPPKKVSFDLELQ
ncbi:MAG TPA: protein-disulfide reductase DsbD family protein [Panacibacter sp.]|nr:protein-disulfide reductase DsbD family protein [Panacibacter sp.]